MTSKNWSSNALLNRGLFEDGMRSASVAAAAYAGVSFVQYLPILNLGTGQSNDDYSALLLFQGCTLSTLMILLFAAICVSRVFRFMFKGSSAVFVGALPVSRRTAFLSRYAAALAALLAANLVAYVIIAVASLQIGFGPGVTLPWLGVTSAMVVVCTSMCALCASLAANRQFYIILVLMANGYLWAMEAGVIEVASMLVPGLSSLSVGALNVLSPVAYVGLNMSGMMANVNPTPSVLILCAYLVASAAMVALSAWLYTRRQLEVAGDGLAFACVRPVLSVLFSVAAGLGFALLVLAMLGHTDVAGYSRSGHMFFAAELLALMLVGGIGAQVLFEGLQARSFGVVRKRIRVIAVTVVLCAAFVLGASCDVLGIGSAVPLAKDVESVTVSDIVDKCDSPEVVEDAIALQKRVLAAYELGEMELPEGMSEGEERGLFKESGSMVGSVSFTYKLTDGSTLYRQYDLGYLGDARDSESLGADVVAFSKSDAVKKAQSQRIADAASGEGPLGKARFEVTRPKGAGSDELTSVLLTADEAKRLCDEALSADIADGALGMSLEYPADNGAVTLSVMYFEGEGFTPWEYGLSDTSIAISRERTPRTAKWLEKNLGIFA